MVRPRSPGIPTLRSGVFGRQRRARSMRKRNCSRSPPIPGSRHCPSHSNGRNQRFNQRPRSTLLPEGLRDPNSLVRLGALQSLANAPLNARVPLAPPLLADPLKAVRIEAVSMLAPVPAEQLSPEQRAAFERAASEYVATQRYNADRADARVNLGTFYANRGDAVKAEEEIKAAIRLEPFFIPAYVNLADLYRARGRDAEGERILREGLKSSAKERNASPCLGLALVRMKRTGEALGEFERATDA